jgi:hypothetical protein
VEEMLLDLFACSGDGDGGLIEGLMRKIDGGRFGSRAIEDGGGAAFRQMG